MASKATQQAAGLTLRQPLGFAAGHNKSESDSFVVNGLPPGQEAIISRVRSSSSEGWQVQRRIEDCHMAYGTVYQSQHHALVALADMVYMKYPQPE